MLNDSSATRNLGLFAVMVLSTMLSGVLLFSVDRRWHCDGFFSLCAIGFVLGVPVAGALWKTISLATAGDRSPFTSALSTSLNVVFVAAFVIVAGLEFVNGAFDDAPGTAHREGSVLETRHPGTLGLTWVERSPAPPRSWKEAREFDR